MKTEVFECECFSDEHQFNFILDKADDDSQLYLSAHLRSWESWWKRAWTGIKYTFGFTSKYGAWDCVILKQKDAERLSKLLEEYLNPVPGVKTHYLTVTSEKDGKRIQKILENNDIEVETIRTRPQG